MDDRKFRAFAAVQIVAVAAILWLVFSQSGPWDLQHCVGATLTIVGIGGIATARFQLGKSFSAKAEARELVTRGIYSRIRNPIYIFGVVLATGVLLTLRRPILWLSIPAIVVMQIKRARREAQVLEAAFGEAYREYRRKTWFEARPQCAR